MAQCVLEISNNFSSGYDYLLVGKFIKSISSGFDYLHFCKINIEIISLIILQVDEYDYLRFGNFFINFTSGYNYLHFRKFL